MVVVVVALLLLLLLLLRCCDPNPPQHIRSAQGEATGSVGCAPCRDGSYSPPGDSSPCRVCPRGTYSTRTQYHNHLACPNSTTVSSPTATTPQGFLDLSAALQAALLPPPDGTSDPACAVLAGADDCTPCPSSAPYTEHNGTTSVAGCKRCPWEHFYRMGACVPATPPCQGANIFERDPLTEESDRVCSFCDRSTCTETEAPSACPGNILGLPERGCTDCTGKPQHNARCVVCLRSDRIRNRR